MAYKVNIEESKGFLYTNNEILETEIREKIPFDMKNKVPRNNTNQESKRPVLRKLYNTEEGN